MIRWLVGDVFDGLAQLETGSLVFDGLLGGE